MRPRFASRALVTLAAALASAALSYGTPARANGRMASANQIVASPVDPSLLVIESTVGLLVSHDSGESFEWVCEGSVGYADGGPQDPWLAVTPKYFLAGLRQGLSQSPDQGCSWKLALHDAVADLVVRADNPHSGLALTSVFSGVSDAGENLWVTRVLATGDDGDTWAPQGVDIDPTVTVVTLEVARSDPNRIYIGGFRLRPSADAGGLERVGVVLASTNGGASYSETDIAFAFPQETKYAAAYVSAVDPANADLVYVRIGDTLVDRLVVSDDGAKTFSGGYQATGPLPGFALSGDGTKLVMGGPFDGVLVASAGADAGTRLSFHKQSTTDVSCLGWIGSTLYACVRIPGNAFFQYVGASRDDGVSFAPKFHLGCVAGPLTCPGSSLATACSPGLSTLHGSVGPCPDGGPPGEAGNGDSGNGSDGPDGAGDDASSATPDAGVPGARPRGGCGCEAGETAGAAGGLSACFALGLALRRRRARCPDAVDAE